MIQVKRYLNSNETNNGSPPFLIEEKGTIEHERKILFSTTNSTIKKVGIDKNIYVRDKKYIFKWTTLQQCRLATVIGKVLYGRKKFALRRNKSYMLTLLLPMDIFCAT